MATKLLNRKKVNPSILIHTGEKHVEKISLQLFKYNELELIEKQNYSISELKDFNEKEYIHWLNIHGIHDLDLIKKICSLLDIHELVIQDILDINQRPKLEEFEKYNFFTLKTLLPSKNSTFYQEQISFILGKNYLVSFQEKKGDYFNHIRERLRNKIGIVRERSSDYLLFLLFESILDNYFKSLNEIECNIEEKIVLEIDKDPSPSIIKYIEQLRRQVGQIKKIIVPIKEIVIKLEREEFSFIAEKHIKYYYELKDLCLSLIDNCDHLETKLSSHSNMFFSIQGHRMNQIMKTLTVVATIFIPLTFIAGIYGMNFSNMPELNWKYGYYGFWLVIAFVLIGMIIYFKKKKWY